MRTKKVWSNFRHALHAIFSFPAPLLAISVFAPEYYVHLCPNSLIVHLQSSEYKVAGSSLSFSTF